MPYPPVTQFETQERRAAAGARPPVGRRGRLRFLIGRLPRPALTRPAAAREPGCATCDS